MKDTTWGQEYLKELEAEVAATRKCLERIPDDLFKWKPHNKSMDMGTLAFIVADIPRWITTMVKASEIDFVKFKHDEPKTTGDLVKFFDEHMKSARNALQNVSDEALAEPFYLKNNGQVVFTSPKKDNISSSINHLLHNNDQLTVFMLLNNIQLPPISYPSSLDLSF